MRLGKYIMKSAGLDEAQSGIKIARRNINNLRYADLRKLRYANIEALWQKVKKN